MHSPSSPYLRSSPTPFQSWELGAGSLPAPAPCDLPFSPHLGPLILNLESSLRISSDTDSQFLQPPRGGQRGARAEDRGRSGHIPRGLSSGHGGDPTCIYVQCLPIMASASIWAQHSVFSSSLAQGCPHCPDSFPVPPHSRQYTDSASVTHLKSPPSRSHHILLQPPRLLHSRTSQELSTLTVSASFPIHSCLLHLSIIEKI